MRLPWGLRWWELLPEAVLALALGLFFIMETSAATSAFSSTTAIKFMAVVVVVWLVSRFLLVRYTHWPGVRLIVFALAAAGVAAVVILPAYDDTTVVERLPAVPYAETNPSVRPRPPDGAADSPEPVALRSSMIHGIDHRARGTAVIYRQPDGALLVGLEDIDIQPGPDYDVYVVPGADRDDTDRGIRLDDLRGNKGTQYYPVPTGTNVITGPWTVLVWCQTFDVPVAGATLA